MTSNRQAGNYKKWIYQQVLAIFWLAIWLAGCSSVREANETPEDPIEVTTPVTIETDEQRQRIYNQGTGSNAAPLAKPNLNQASDINKKKNIENFGTDKPALTPNEARPQEIRIRVDTVPGR